MTLRPRKLWIGFLILCHGLGLSQAATSNTSVLTEGNRFLIDSRLAIPEVASDYVHIYKPQPDVYKGRDTKNYTSGEIYNTWQPNDHTFIQDPNGRWHCFGITRPHDNLNDETHEAGGFKLHALAPEGTLEQAFLPETWIDQPKIRFGGAPYCIKIGDTYHLINSAYDHLTSKDLYQWNDKGKLNLNCRIGQLKGEEASQ